MPAVTWIDMQPESSSRTSLKSLTDYLTETQDDTAVFTPSNRLCLSPETLNALDNAEKLVEDVETQLSQLQFDDSLTDDTEEDRFNGVKFNDDRLHIQNVVKNVFQKGYYEPAPRPIFNKDNVSCKYARNDKSSKLKSSKMLSIPINRRAEPSVAVDECLLCKSNKANESAKQMAFDGYKAITETSSAVAAAAGQHVEETKINEDKPEKLNVQKGPAISIKGPLAVQTAKIIDIKPVQHIVAKRLENIVTYECQHLEKNDDEVSILNAKKLERDTIEIRDDQRKSSNKSAVNYSRKRDDSDELMADKETRFWDACEDEQLDLDDFSLREPRILVEVDAVLQQQRNIIRQVHEATEKFDRFLSKRMPIESPNVSLEDSLENRLADKQTNPCKYNKLKKLSSEIDDELGKNNKIDTRHENSLWISRESLKPTNSASFSKRIINENRAAESNKPSSSTTLVGEASNKIFQDTSKPNLTVTNKSSSDHSKETQYSENFESESSDDESKSGKSQSLKLKSAMHVKNTDKEMSFVQTSVHTQTKSNAGFIENLKSSPSLKDNNLAVNLQKANISRNDVSTSIENSSVDKNLHSRRSFLEKKKTDDQSNVSEKKGNQVRISETDDERELHNYEFDADLLEGTNEHARVISEKMDGKVDDDVEFRQDKSTEKLQDNPDGNSQKTSHLIDSISDISLHGSSEQTKSSQESQKMSFASSNSRTSLPNIKENAEEKAVSELSTESKIEIKISEARDNLKLLMKTINFSVNKEANDNSENINIVDREPDKLIEKDERQSKDNDIPQIMKNITLRSNDARRQNSRISNGANVINQEYNDVPNDRSFLAILQKNSETVQHSVEQQKLLLLKNLESCSIGTPKRGKRLFTSTIVGDTCPPVNFTRSTESSTIRQDSSSDSNSEGEIRLNSTASHSLGEIRTSIFENKSSCSTKGSTTTSSGNLNNNTSSLSAGEVRGLNEN